MSDISRDAWLNERARHRRKGRSFVSHDELRWGELILPAEGENPGKTVEGLRVLAIASMPIGYPVLRTLEAYEQHFPKRLNLVGLLTDDPLNDDARISVRKRIWHLYPPRQRAQLELATVESGRLFGDVLHGKAGRDDATDRGQHPIQAGRTRSGLVGRALRVAARPSECSTA